MVADLTQMQLAALRVMANGQWHLANPVKEAVGMDPDSERYDYILTDLANQGYLDRNRDAPQPLFRITDKGLAAANPAVTSDEWKEI